MRENLLIIGAGVSGLGAAKLSSKFNYNVRLSSKDLITCKNKKLLNDLNIDFEEGQHSLSNLKWTNLIIKSPGVPQDILLIKKARQIGIPIVSEIEFAYRHTNAEVIAITGTNGKTTTSKLLYHICQSAGLNVSLAGNIGVSFSESIIRKKADYYILEISSFQLEDIIDFKPKISILLNLNEDHLNRYDYQFSNYIKTKMRIQMNQNSQDTFIYFHNDDNIQDYLNTVKAIKCPFGKDNITPNIYGAWIKDNKITINTIKTNFTMTIHNLALQGTHNFYNSMAASIAATSMGIKKDIIKKSLSNFKGVEHRLEFVAKISGTTFINDSKATNCNAVYYALETISSPIIWICGGIDKGNDYSILKDLVSSKVKAIVILGDNGKKILNNFQNDIDTIIQVGSMQDAVSRSFNISEAGDTVLLSPACASFDLFASYQERGRIFKDSVLSI